MAKNNFLAEVTFLAKVTFKGRKAGLTRIAKSYFFVLTVLTSFFIITLQIISNGRRCEGPRKDKRETSTS